MSYHAIKRRPSRPLAHSYIILTVLALVGSLFLSVHTSTPAQAATFNVGHGVGAYNKTGGWTGAYRAQGSNGTETWWCAESTKKGPDVGSIKFGSKTTVTNLRGIGRANTRTISYLLWKWGQTTSSSTGASLRLAFMQLTDPGYWATNKFRYNSSWVTKASEMLAEARAVAGSDSGSYTVNMSGLPANGEHNHTYAVKLNVTGPAGGKMPKLTLRYRWLDPSDTENNGFAWKEVTTNSNGNATISVKTRKLNKPAPGTSISGSSRLQVKVDSIPELTLTTREPDQDGIQRVMLAGQSDSLSEEARTSYSRETPDLPPDPLSLRVTKTAKPDLGNGEGVIGAVFQVHLATSSGQPGQLLATKTYTASSHSQGYLEFAAIKPDHYLPENDYVVCEVSAPARWQSENQCRDVSTVGGTTPYLRATFRNRPVPVDPSIATTASVAEPQTLTPLSMSEDGSGVQIIDDIAITGLWHTPGRQLHGLAELHGPFTTHPQAHECRSGNRIGRVSFEVTENQPIAPVRMAVYEPGYYTWVVSIEGDEFNTDAVSACGEPSETVKVMVEPKIDTHVTDSVLHLGESVQDNITVSGLDWLFEREGSIPLTWTVFGPALSAATSPENTCPGPNDPAWEQAPVFAQDMVELTAADHVTEHITPNAPGCYTYQAELPETEFSHAEQHEIGITEETFQVLALPQVSTAISATIINEQEQVYDEVTLTDSGDIDTHVHMKLWGPIPATMVDDLSVCPVEADSAWDTAELIQEETLFFHGNQTLTTTAHTLEHPGCYTYTAHIDADALRVGFDAAPGHPDETVFVQQITVAPPVPDTEELTPETEPEPTPTPKTASSPDPGVEPEPDIELEPEQSAPHAPNPTPPGLAYTGASMLPLAGFAGLALAGLGAATLGFTRKRR